MPINIINNRIKSVGFRNLSSYTPSPLELRALKKGLNFVPMKTYAVSKYFRSDLKAAFQKYARLFHLRWHFRNNSDSIANIDKRSVIHKKLYIPSNWLPPLNQRNPSINNYLSKTRSLLLSLSHNLTPLPYHNISKAEFSALYSLCQRPDLVITKADKNLGIVLMDTKDYCYEAYRHLNDKSTYK